jgi:hypothetical protein
VCAGTTRENKRFTNEYFPEFMLPYRHGLRCTNPAGGHWGEENAKVKCGAEVRGSDINPYVDIELQFRRSE